jgi:hypothetical protein
MFSVCEDPIAEFLDTTGETIGPEVADEKELSGVLEPG